MRFILKIVTVSSSEFFLLCFESKGRGIMESTRNKKWMQCVSRESAGSTTPSKIVVGPFFRFNQQHEATQGKIDPRSNQDNHILL